MPDENSPHHNLARIQELCGWKRYNISGRAADDARRLCLTEQDIIRCVGSLKPADFYSSKPSEKHPGRHQDAYKVNFSGKRLYVKLDADVDWAMIFSFHEDL
jgi:hypothetical protein